MHYSAKCSVVDIGTGLVTCMRATRISSWVSLNVSGKPSEGQLINCWIRAPPLGGGDHVTKRLAVHIRLSLGGRSLLPVVLEIGCLLVIIFILLLYLHLLYFVFFIRLVASTLDAPDTKLSNTH